MSMMGELNFFLRLQFKQMKHGTFLSQTKYYIELIKKFGMEKCKEASTLMATSTYLELDEIGKSVDESRYGGMIGSLLYLTASRPYIMLSVCLCARYQANPKESHLTTIKRVIKYLKGITNVGLWYPKGASLNLTGFSDFDFANCKLDIKSTSETSHLLGSSLVSWNFKKQAYVVLSTIKAEYIRAS